MTISFATNSLMTRWYHTFNLGLSAMGPGFLMAAAAIGASHLVAATRAGAEFGWQLAWVILGVNLLKYPFFAAGTRYTIATGESLLHGYLRQGRGYLLLFSGLNIIAAVANTAGVSMLTAAMLTQFIPLPIDWLSLLVLISAVMLLILGRYQVLDKMSKVIMLALTITTLIAVTLAWEQAQPLAPEFIPPSPWQWAYMGFLVAMMGWMPAPIEISAWNSIWLLEKQKTQAVTKAQALLDFNVGYAITALLAIVFLALGALVMHGGDAQFSDSGAQFAHQLISLYSQVIGSESRYLIGTVAFLCIFSTTVTLVDGYSRTIEISWQLLHTTNTPHTKGSRSPRRLHRIMITIGLISLLLILFFKGGLLPLLECVMILAFMTTLIFAWLNYRLMTCEYLPSADRFSVNMKRLSWAGLSYLLLFIIGFMYWLCLVRD